MSALDRVAALCNSAGKGNEQRDHDRDSARPSLQPLRPATMHLSTAEVAARLRHPVLLVR